MKFKEYIDKINLYLNEKGHKVEYEIKRETSKYNKNMKWHLIYYFENGNKTSEWFKTKKEAEYHVGRSIERGKEGKFGIYSEYKKR